MKKGFTLLEIVIVLVVLGILATLSLPLYQNTIENAKIKVCETNLKAIRAAIEIYGLENDRMPGSISQLKPEHLRKAWAKIFKEENSWKIKLPYFIIDLQNKGLLYAQDSFVRRYLGGDIKLITCPKDETPPRWRDDGTIEGRSYGINIIVAEKNYKEYKNLDKDTLVVGDCEAETFESPERLTARHISWKITGKKKYVITITKGGEKEIKQFLRCAPQSYDRVRESTR